jgi:hypothetical protein
MQFVEDFHPDMVYERSAYDPPRAGGSNPAKAGIFGSQPCPETRNSSERSSNLNRTVNVLSQLIVTLRKIIPNFSHVTFFSRRQQVEHLSSA